MQASNATATLSRPPTLNRAEASEASYATPSASNHAHADLEFRVIRTEDIRTNVLSFDERLEDVDAPIPTSEMDGLFSPKASMSGGRNDEEIIKESQRFIQNYLNKDVMYFVIYNSIEISACKEESFEAQVMRLINFVSMTPKLISHVPIGDNYQIWAIVSKHYSNVSFAQQQVALRTITAISWRPEESLPIFFTRFERLCESVNAAGDAMTVDAQVRYILSGLLSYEAFVRDLNMHNLVKIPSLAYLKNYLLQHSKNIKDTTIFKSMQGTTNQAAFAHMEQGASAHTCSRDHQPAPDKRALERRGSRVKSDTVCRTWIELKSCPFGLTCKFTDTNGQKHGGNTSVPNAPCRVRHERRQWWVDCPKGRYPPRPAREVAAFVAAAVTDTGDYEDEDANMAFCFRAIAICSDGTPCSDSLSPNGKTLVDSGSSNTLLNDLR
jgi:hypothetical protein